MPISACASRLITIFAHPDDEFAIFPWLKLATEQGRDVHCVWLTDGGWGGQDQRRRRLESIAVLSSLGVVEANMHFLGEAWSIPDGSLYRNLNSLIPRLRHELQYLLPDAELLIPAWEGGHQDHDASHLVGLALMAMTRNTTFQYPLYNGFGLKGPFFSVMRPLPANGPVHFVNVPLWRRLEHSIRCLRYFSQWKSFLGLLPLYVWRMRHSDAFCLQPVQIERTGNRPHPGALLYERRGGPSWEEFCEKTSGYRFQLSTEESPYSGR